MNMTTPKMDIQRAHHRVQPGRQIKVNRVLFLLAECCCLGFNVEEAGLVGCLDEVIK